VLTGIKLAEMVKVLGKSLKELSNVELYPQININCVVKDKMKIINSEELNKEIEKQEKLLDDTSRIMVRVSGTEKKIRIMVESLDEKQALMSAKEIEKVILAVDKK
jgi:phosphoglucosamine mutase